MSNLKSRHLKTNKRYRMMWNSWGYDHFFFVPIAVAFVTPKATGNPPFINVFFSKPKCFQLTILICQWFIKSTFSAFFVFVKISMLLILNIGGYQKDTQRVPFVDAEMLTIL